MRALEALGIFRRAPDPRPESEIAADVRAELEHHLACAADELVRAGRSPEEAAAEARRRFGDLASVQRACLKIQTGERTMLQRVHLAVTVFLFLAVGFMAWVNLESRRTAAVAREVAMAARMEAEERLRAVLEAEQHARAQTDPAVIEAGDVLEVFDALDLGLQSVEAVVPENGIVAIPGLMPVKVAGLTCEEAAEALSEAGRAVRMRSHMKVRIKPGPQPGTDPDPAAPR